MTSLSRIVTVLGMAAVLGQNSSANAAVAPTDTARAGLAHYDVRLPATGGRVGRVQKPLNPAARRAVDQWRGRVSQAEKTLASKLPGARVEFSQLLGVPEIVTRERGALVDATVAAGRNRSSVLRTFVKDNAELFGLSATQVDAFETVADYSNPAGNLSWVEIEQRFHGIPVFLGTLRGAFGADGSLGRVVGEVVPAVDAASVSPLPRLSASEAVERAAANLGVQTKPNDFTVKQSEDNGRKITLAKGPFERETVAQLRYFPLAAGELTLAWSIVVWQDVPAYYMFIDADSGEVLFRKNITNHQSFTYKVYTGDSPAPGSPTVLNPNPSTIAHPPCVAAQTLTVVSEMTGGFSDPWLATGATTTTGNNVDAYLDLDSDNVPDGRPTATGGAFSFNYTPGGCGANLGGDAPSGAVYRDGITTNLFFQTNRFHDRMYAYGFTEAARNFQQNNFSRGGAGNDRVLAEAQDGATERCGFFSCPRNNANFATPPDGQSGRCQMYIWDSMNPDRDGDVDMDIVFHELGHGVNGRLHGDAGGLAGNAGGGMNEGWADFLSRVMLADANEDANGIFPMGAYATYQLGSSGSWSNPAASYYFGIRNFPYAVKTNLGPNGRPHNPLTLADVDPGKVNYSDGAYADSTAIGNTANQVHNVGNVWATALNEVRARIVNQMGFPAGNDRAALLVIDGMKLDPANPTLIQARNSILEADRLGFACASEQQIWEGFATRGWGFEASAPDLSLASGSVTESFSLPNITIATVSFSDCGGNGNDAADPGETIVVSVPLFNPWCSKPATSVTASVDGGPVSSFDNILGRSTSTELMSYTVPAGAVCGSVINVSVSVNSSLGAITRTFPLRIGKQLGAPVALQNFDGVTAPALPTGWSMTTAGTQPRAWQTSSTVSVSSPNSMLMIGPYPLNTSDNAITSAQFTVPAGWTGAELSFKHRFQGEGGWDGGVLDISVGGGAYQDIITAGGSWVENGYITPLGSGSSNPIAGRNSWTGDSAGWITTRVNLPASVVAGSNVRLRWRWASDNCCGTGDPIWAIDDLSWKNNNYSCAAGTGGTPGVTGAPTGVTATATAAKQITVAWISTGAREYLVFRATTPGGPYTQIGSSTGTSFADIHVIQNTTYFYVVRAVSCSESVNSNEASATVLCASAPAFNTALTRANTTADANCSIQVTWHPATSLCASGVKYAIYRGIAANFIPSSANRITEVTGTSFIDSGSLAPNTPYWYVVRAIDASSNIEDANLARVTATTGAGCVQRPIGARLLTVTSTGGSGQNSGVNTLEWSAAAGSTVVIRWSDSSFPATEALGNPLGTTFSTNASGYGTTEHSGLALDTPYFYSVFVTSASRYSIPRSALGTPINTTGRTKWAYSTGAASLTAPGISSPGLYMVSNDRFSHAVQSATAGGEWLTGWIPYATNGASQGRPQIVNTSTFPVAGSSKTIFVTSHDGSVAALDAGSGAQLWRRALTDALSNPHMLQASAMFISRNWSTPALPSDLVIVGTRNATRANTVFGIDAQTGIVLWEFTPSPSMGIVSDRVSVMPARRLVFAASRRSNLSGGSSKTLRAFTYAYDAVTGWTVAETWSEDVGDVDGGTNWSGDKVFVGNNSGEVYVRHYTGTGGWAAPFATLDGPVKSVVLVVGTRLYFATTNKVWAVNDGGANGSEAWSLAADENSAAIRPSPLIYTGAGVTGGPYLLFGSNNGKLYRIGSLSATPSIDGLQLGATTTVLGSPASSGVTQMFYVGSDAGTVYGVSVQ